MNQSPKYKDQNNSKTSHYKKYQLANIFKKVHEVYLSVKRNFVSFNLNIAFNWQRMCFSIEHIFIQWNRGTVSKQQVQILESLPQKECLHFVPSPGRNCSNIIQGCISTTTNLCVPLECFENLPSPCTVPAVRSYKHPFFLFLFFFFFPHSMQIYETR